MKIKQKCKCGYTEGFQAMGNNYVQCPKCGQIYYTLTDNRLIEMCYTPNNLPMRSV